MAKHAVVAIESEVHKCGGGGGSGGGVGAGAVGAGGTLVAILGLALAMAEGVIANLIAEAVAEQWRRKYQQRQ